MAGLPVPLTQRQLDELTHKTSANLVPLGATTVPCQNANWTLTVKVSVQQEWRGHEGFVTVTLTDTGTNAVDGIGMVYLPKNQKSAEMHVRGRGPKTLQATAAPDDDDWEAVAAQTITVQDGKHDYQMTLEIKSKPWISFIVLYEKTGASIANCTMDATLPGAVQKNLVTADTGVTEKKLNPGTTTITKITHATENWVFVSIDSK